MGWGDLTYDNDQKSGTLLLISQIFRGYLNQSLFSVGILHFYEQLKGVVHLSYSNF